jgi:hypothetical protein
MSAVDCQYKRCSGTVDIQASGIDEDRRPVQLGTCDRCGRITSVVPDVEQDALPGLDVEAG